MKIKYNRMFFLIFTLFQFMSLEERIESQIRERVENNTFRKLTQSDGKIDFTSNDYLGLAQSTALAALIKQNSDGLKLPSGSTGSRLLSGNNLITEQLEQKLGILFKGEALLFNSGYTANLAVLSALPQRGDTIIYDELAHACIKDGARLSLASRYSFRHNDLNDLEAKLKRAKEIFLLPLNPFTPWMAMRVR
jgi:7-keto-8-aminopelargonate synthetase and related enzymes